MAEIRTEEKQVTLTTRVFLCEFTQEEVDALCSALEYSVTRRPVGLPRWKGVQRKIWNQLKSLSDPVKPIDLGDNGDDGNDDDEEEDDNA